MAHVARWRGVAALTVLAAGSVLPVIDSAAAAGPPGPAVRADETPATTWDAGVYLLPATPVRPGGSSVLDGIVLVTPAGSSDQHAPGHESVDLSLRFDLPTGASLGRVLPSAPGETSSVAWSCESTTCRLDGEVPDSGRVDLTVEVLVADGVRSALDVGVVPDGEGVSGADVRVTIPWTPSDDGPLHLSHGALPTVAPSERIEVDVDVLNTGPGALTDLMVDGIVPEDFDVISLGGPGWSCDQTGTCISAGPLDELERAILRLVAIAPPEPTEQSILLTTSAEAVESTGGVVSADVESLIDVAFLSTTAGVAVRATGREPSTLPGAITHVDVTLAPDHPGATVEGPLHVHVELPAGTHASSTDADWTCEPAGADAMLCTRDGAIAADTAVTLPLAVHVADNAPIGPAGVAVHAAAGAPPEPVNDQPVADQLASDLGAPLGAWAQLRTGIDRDLASFHIVEPGSPRLAVTLEEHADGVGDPRPLDDGRPVGLVVGVPHHLVVHAHNVGAGPTVPGDTATVRFDLPHSSTAIEGDGWTCEPEPADPDGLAEAHERHRCTAALTHPVEPGERLAPITVTVVADDTADAAQWSAGAHLTGHTAITQAFTSDAIHLRPSLAPVFSARRHARPGGTGLVVLGLENRGAAAAPGASVQIGHETHEVLHVSAVNAPGTRNATDWTCTPNPLLDRTTCEWSAVIEPGESSPPLHLEYTGVDPFEPVVLDATAATSGQLPTPTARSSFSSMTRHALTADAGPNLTVGTPVTTAIGRTAPTVTLRGAATTSANLTHRWEQLCTTPPDPTQSCAAFTPAVRGLDLADGATAPTSGTARFQAAGIAPGTTLLFRYSVEEHGATATDIVSVTLVPALSVGDAGEGLAFPDELTIVTATVPEHAWHDDVDGDAGSDPAFAIAAALHVHPDAPPIRPGTLSDVPLAIGAPPKVLGVATTADGVVVEVAASGLPAERRVQLVLQPAGSPLVAVTTDQVGTLRAQFALPRGTTGDIAVVADLSTPPHHLVRATPMPDELLVPAAMSAITASPAADDLTLRRSPVGTVGAAVEKAAHDLLSHVTGTAVETSWSGIGQPRSGHSTNAPAVLCAAAAAVAASGSGISVGPHQITSIGTSSTSTSRGPTCPGGGPNRIDLHGASIDLFGAFAVTSITGTFDAEGLRLTGGSLVPPAASGLPSFTLGQHSEIYVGFTSDGSVGPVGATLHTDGFPVVDLPHGWAATSTLTFAHAGQTQQISFDANATSGTRSIDATGSLDTDGSFQLSLTSPDLIELAGSPVAVAGSLTYQSGGDASISATGSLTSPATIMDGLAITALDVTWDDSGIAASGTVEISVHDNAITLSAAGTYQNSDTWSLTVDAAADDWTVAPGLTLSSAGFSGSITSAAGDHGPEYTFAVAASASGDWSPIPAVTVTSISASITNDCPSGSTPPCGVVVEIAGSGTLDLSFAGGPTVHGGVSGTVHLDSGVVDLKASVGSVSLFDGASIDTASLQVHVDPHPAGGGDAEVTVTLSGSATVIGVHADLVATISPQGFVATADLGSFSPLPGVSFPDLHLAYTTFATSIDPSGGSDPSATLDLAPGSITAFAPFQLPSDVTAILPGGISKGWATISLTPDGAGIGQVEVHVAFPDDWYLFGSASSPTSLRLADVVLFMSAGGGQFTVGVGADADLVMSTAAPGGSGSTTLELSLTASISVGDTGPTITGTLELKDPEGWHDAFGVDGLVLYDLAIAVGVSEISVDLGLSATATLPPSMTAPLGISPDAVISVTAEISDDHPCFAFDVSAPAGENALDIGRGALTATSFGMTIAPNGCIVGSTSFPPGFAIHFHGAILGVGVDVEASYSVMPFSIDASIDVGAFQVGPVSLDETTMHLKVEPTTWSVEFSGGFHVDGVNVTVSGDVSASPSGFKLDLSAGVDHLPLGPTSGITSLTLSVSVDMGATTAASIALDGDFVILGQAEKISLSGSYANGTIQSLNGSVVATIPIRSVELDGTFTVDYTKGSPPVITFDVSFAVDGHRVTEATGTIDGNGLSITGSISVPGVFDATLTGAIVWGSDASQPPVKVRAEDGSLVDGSVGDASFSAEGVTLDLAGFHATGDIALGTVHGVSYLQAHASFVIGDDSGVTVDVSGSIDSSGNFSFTGEAHLVLVGFGLDVDLTVSRQGGTVTVGGTAQLDVGNVLSVAVSGNFERTTGTPRYSLTGTASLSLPVGSTAGSVTLGNEPGNSGVRISLSITAGSVLTASGSMTLTPEGLYAFDGSGALSAGSVHAAVDVAFTNCADRACTSGGAVSLHADGSVSIAGFTLAASITLSTDGHFETTLKLDSGSRSHGFNFKVVKGTVSSDFSASVSFSDSGPGSVNVHTTGSLKYQIWAVTWGKSHTISVGIDGSVSGGHVHLRLDIKIAGTHIKIDF